MGSAEMGELKIAVDITCNTCFHWLYFTFATHNLSIQHWTVIMDLLMK
jgi:hypothetical protein